MIANYPRCVINELLRQHHLKHVLLGFPQLVKALAQNEINALHQCPADQSFAANGSLRRRGSRLVGCRRRWP